MKKRYLSDIKLVGNSLIEFKHSEEFFTCSYTIKDFDAIDYNKNFGTLYFCTSGRSFYPSSKDKMYTVTEEDFEEFRSVILKSPQVVSCGHYIFSLDNILTFSKGTNEDVLFIDCRNGGYLVKTNGKEEIKAFGITMRKKWQDTLSEFDQSKESVNIEEDTLIK